MPELKHEHSVVVETPPDEVYEYVSDLRRHNEWNHSPQEIKKVTEGPVEVGTLFHTTEEPPRDVPWLASAVILPLYNKLLGIKDYTGAELTALEPGHRVAWQAWMPMRGDKRFQEVHWEIVLEPQNGSTRVTQRSHWIPKHWLANPSAFADIVASEVEKNLASLKKTLEEG